MRFAFLNANRFHVMNGSGSSDPCTTAEKPRPTNPRSRLQPRTRGSGAPSLRASALGFWSLGPQSSCRPGDHHGLNLKAPRRVERGPRKCSSCRRPPWSPTCRCFHVRHGRMWKIRSLQHKQKQQSDSLNLLFASNESQSSCSRRPDLRTALFLASLTRLPAARQIWEERLPTLRCRPWKHAPSADIGEKTWCNTSEAV